MVRKFIKSLSRYSQAAVINKRGKDVLTNSWYNKGTAFTRAERDRLGVKGLLPTRILTMKDQVDRFLTRFRDPGLSAIDKVKINS